MTKSNYLEMKKYLYEQVEKEINKLGVERLKNGYVMYKEETIEQFIERITERKGKQERRREKINGGSGLTTLQHLSIKDLWGSTGEDLRKSLLEYYKFD